MKPISFIYFTLISIFSFSQSQSVLLLDDFENFSENSFGEETTTFPDTLGSTIYQITIKDLDAFCHSGKSLLINYALSSDSNGFAGYVSILPSLDLTTYNYLSFWVKSMNGLDMVLLELERANGEKSKISIWNYLACGTSNEWQKVVIPLDAFWNLYERTEVIKMVLSFESRSNYFNESPFAGEIYFDDFLFGTYFPGYVKFDPFSDKLPANGTGANNGSFSPSGSETNYTNQLICNNFLQNNCDCHLRLNFDNGEEDDFGGYFGILGGGEDGFTKVGHLVAQYDSLYFEAFANNSATNPGNFKIELKTNNNNKYEKRISGIETAEKSFLVAISDFDIVGNPDSINEFTIVFEKGQQEVLSGIVYLDEFELRSEGVELPDVSKPEAPQNVTLNGATPMGISILDSNTIVEVSAMIEHMDIKLESIRLEYYNGCRWICLRKEYPRFDSSQIDLSFSTNEVPNSLQLEMRVVLENYNGINCPSSSFAILVQNNDISKEAVFKNSFELLQFLRAETGVYLDATILDETAIPFHPASVATTGMGLISLCIADTMGWLYNAEELVLETLKSMNGLNSGFSPERNCMGWFRHFIDEFTGKVPDGWDSEFSSIDSGILAAGGLFCKKYFANNDSIGMLADALFLSIDWASTIEDPETGGIFRVSDIYGNGSGITLPFNEYMIVAWLAKNYFRDNDSASELWDLHYSNPSQLLKSNYMGIEVLTDFPGNFLPGFVPQFNYYLCNYFTTQPSYIEYFKNAMIVDTLWWRNNTDASCFIWGYGAGSSCDWVPSAYNADNIIEHPGTICSPHIIGGFIPINSKFAEDLLNLKNASLGVYDIPTTDIEILWRFSVEDPTWLACDVQGIDISTILLGLATHPDFLGKEFFEQYNNFDFPDENSFNFPPLINNSSFPQTIILENCQKNLVVLGLVNDINHAISLLDWSIIDHENIQIEITSSCEILISADSTFSGSKDVIISVTDPDGDTDEISVNIIASDSCLVVGINEVDVKTAHLSQNSPNPFNKRTTIQFEIPQSSNVTFSIIKISGKVCLHDELGVLPSGNHEIVWDGINDRGQFLSAGIYFYSIRTDESIIVKKLVLHK